MAAAQADQMGPATATRLSAYSAVTLHEGFASDPQSGLRSLAGQMNGLWSVPVVAANQPVDGATVAAEAVRIVLDSLLGGGMANGRRMMDSLAIAQIEKRRRAGVGNELRLRSITHGRGVADAVLAWAATDRSLAAQMASRSSPAENSPNPSWGTLRTFALRNGDECAPPPPPKYSERRGSDFWTMGREMYDSASALTPEKRTIALFWADAPTSTATAAFHWMSAVNQVIASRSLTADQAVEAYALTSVAIADAFAGSWKEKYRSRVLRPEAYVHRVLDAQWTPLVTTPASPEYPSDHSVVSGAAAEVLITLLGDSTVFTDSAATSAGASARTYRGFSHARDEAALAGIYGGTQFVPGTVQGLAQGRCIGQRVRARLRTRSDLQ